jgi:hypothetical protein
MRAKLGISIATALLAALIGTGCGAAESASQAPGESQPAGASVGQVRVDTLAQVAKRIYAHEHARVVAAKTIKHLRTEPALIRALESGNRRRIRAEARKPVLGHEVRIRVVRGSRVLMDAGLPNVVQAAQAELRAPDGTDLGLVQVSIQDLIGFVKLVDRETGTRMVVRDRNGHTETAFKAAANRSLPPSGKVEIRGSTYWLRGFQEGDFVGRPLQVWMLDPA